MLICFGAIFLAFGIGYFLLLIYMVNGWNSNISIHPNESNTIKSAVSVLIPVRNEAKNITNCIQSILSDHQYTDDFEIIVINDHSNDNTVDIVLGIASPNVKIIHLPDHLSGKKSAITYGVTMAKNELILCTDGDCKVGKCWIKCHADYLHEFGYNMVTGLVVTETGYDLLSKFQFLDFVSTMCITANGIQRKSYYLANGANMSFRKTFFEQVSGYDNNLSVASGDDLFLIQRASSLDPGKVGFLKTLEAMVETKSEDTWKGFINQRKRWATKSMKVGDKKVIAIQAYVFGFCLLILCGIILGLFFSNFLLYCGLTTLIWKLAVDYWFLSTLTNYYEKQNVMSSFLSVSMVYFFHIIFSGFSALFPSSYQWKERQQV
ncbi:MAG: glycosyltransferase [Saprospiraceae bacterium]|nr:glycosyltransferase [Saprospiraceae bacterium]